MVSINFVVMQHALMLKPGAVASATIITALGCSKDGKRGRILAPGMLGRVAMGPKNVKASSNNSRWHNLLVIAVPLMVSVRANIEHPIKLLKRQVGSTKVLYQDLAKFTAQLLSSEL